MGRRPRQTFRGLIGSSLVLRPTCSRDRHAVLYVEGFDGFVTSTVAPTATGWSEPVAGWELHPLKTYTFARRTASPFQVQSLYRLTCNNVIPFDPSCPRLSNAHPGERQAVEGEALRLEAER